MSNFIKILALSALLAWSALGAPINVGSIVVDDYRITGGATEAFGGLNFIIHYELNANFAKQDCCKKDNLRWLQLAQFIPDQKGFPKGPFIDPQPGQDYGLGKGDDEPWYDVTGAAIDKLIKGPVGLGKGAYLGDGPFANWALGDVEFIVKTVLVCILEPEKDKQAIILGGLSWGYKNDSKKKSTTMQALGQLVDGPALRKEFNDALDAQAKFKDWEIVDAAKACKDNAPCVTLSPEPESGLLILVAIAYFGRLRRRYSR